MATLTGVSPVLIVADLDRSVEYFAERLGFDCQVYGEPPNFAAAGRGAAVILLALAEEPERLVRTVDAIWRAQIERMAPPSTGIIAPVI